ncbi:MAG: DUF3187 family protein [Myxococcaceae bacterium]|nr:MAG: DUF3187 family protein [Myxococcaceae bacterium]
MLSLLVLGVLVAHPPLPPPDFSGLPPWAPQNPIEANRSVLFAPPLMMPRGDWGLTFALDYSSAIELYSSGGRGVTLDAELGRFQVWLTRRIDDQWFVFGQVQIQGAYDGFMDRFLNWYHSLLGVPYIARELRPINKYVYSVTYERGRTIEYGPVDLGIGDSRIGVGRMLGNHAQVLLVLGLPTSTAPGYRAGTLQTGLILMGEAPLLPFATVSGSIGVGFTPKTGTLAAYENTFFASFSGGTRIRLSWRNFIYANLFVQTPPFHDTALRPMDLVDFSIDFGWMYRIDPRTELWVGVVEDPFPDGPALDVAFRFGIRTAF